MYRYAFGEDVGAQMNGNIVPKGRSISSEDQRSPLLRIVTFTDSFDPFSCTGMHRELPKRIADQYHFPICSRHLAPREKLKLSDADQTFILREKFRSDGYLRIIKSLKKSRSIYYVRKVWQQQMFADNKIV